MAQKIKLFYFNARGGGENLRYIFAQAGVEYEDVRIEKEDWPAHKPTTPFGQLPYIEVDGVKLSQSNACARYIAKKYNLAGKTDLEQAQADMLVDCCLDTVKPLFGLFYETDEAVKTAMKKKYNEEQLPGFLTHLEALLKQNHGGDGFLVGTDVTWADIWILSLHAFTSMAGSEDPFGNYPKLKALKERVEKLPKIAAWIEKRPKTER